MTTMTIEIPNKFQKYFFTEKKPTSKQMKMTDFLKKIWVDANFAIKQLEYQKSFVNDLKKGKFTVSDKF